MSGEETRIAAKLNQLYLELEELYHDYARAHGLSDSMLWLLYSLKMHDKQTTQRKLCDEWHTSPQTMNYALKSLERRGFICLEPLKGGKHDKAIILTSHGRDLVDGVIEPLVHSERQAFHVLSETEQCQLLALTSKLVAALHIALEPKSR